MSLTIEPTGASSILYNMGVTSAALQSVEAEMSANTSNASRNDPATIVELSGFDAQLSGMSAAATNAGDAAAMSTTASTTLGTVSQMLSSISSLAVQYQAGGLSTSQQADLQSKANTLMSQISEIESNTTFSSQNLFAQDGSASFTVSADGSNVMQVPTISLQNVIGAGAFDLSQPSTVSELAQAVQNVNDQQSNYTGITATAGFVSQALDEQQTVLQGVTSNLTSVNTAQDSVEVAQLQLQEQVQTALLAQANSLQASMVLKLLG